MRPPWLRCSKYGWLNLEELNPNPGTWILGSEDSAGSFENIFGLAKCHILEL